MRKIIFLILSFFTFSFISAEEIDVNKDYFFLISHRLGLIDFEKTDCSEKNIEKAAIDIKALCYLRNYLENKNADSFIKNSRQLGIDNLAKIDEIVTSINVFSLCFYIFLAEAALKSPQDGLTLLFDIMKNKESHPAIQEAVSLIFYRAPFFTAKNILLIKKLIDEDKNFREFDISCRTSSFHSILGYTDTENIKEAEYVFYRACPNLYKTTKRNKNKKDLFLNEKNGFGLEINVCSLSIATNATEKPIVLKIEEKKELSTITIKGAEKDNLNYFYKYIYPNPFDFKIKRTES